MLIYLLAQKNKIDFFKLWLKDFVIFTKDGIYFILLNWRKSLLNKHLTKKSLDVSVFVGDKYFLQRQ